MTSEVKCPNCGSQMKLRTAQRGKNAGNQFYGWIKTIFRSLSKHLVES